MQRLFSNIAQIPGWKTKRKIVVIESDDWGSVRMSSNDAISILSNKGHDFDNDLYNKYDSLASEEDLSALFEVLNTVKDKNGNPAVLTANAIMANPDFEKIRNSNFQHYYYEVFTETLKKYSKHHNSFALWKEGMKNGIFHPQFHGREHVNIAKWLLALQNDDAISKEAFKVGVFGLKQTRNRDIRNSFMRALDFDNEAQFQMIRESLLDGLSIFKDKMGYASKSFIAPSYVWNAEVEKVLFEGGIKYLQGIRYQYQPVLKSKNLKKQLRFLGQKNQLKQTYLVRNAFFEPTLLGKTDAIAKVLNSVRSAFYWKNPAIIGSHRINFVGYLNEKNRNENLTILKKLLNKIILFWPDVEFMTSDQLGDLINTKN